MEPFITGRKLAAEIRGGRVSSSAATEFFIDRIERLDKATNLVVVKMYPAARARAKEADAALRAGRSWGPLHGVPMTIKENYAIKGVQTTCGMPQYMKLSNGKPYLPDVNAAVVQRLLDAGAVIIGKTNLPEQAADFQSYNAIYGTSKNPWNLAHTPGGSSGGSAGAIAAGLTPVEVGSDIGGSIRTPAHFSGVCGLKPTQGVIDKTGWCPPHPYSLYQEDLAVSGPICRTCDDLSMMLDVLAGPDPARAAGGWRLDLPAPKVTEPRGLRVAVWLDDDYCKVDEEYVAQIRAAAESLKAAGAQVDYHARPDFTFEKAFNIYTGVLNPSMAGQGVNPRIQSRRLKLKKKWEEFWASGYDTLLCPVTPTAAIKIDESGGLAGMAGRRVTVNGVERSYLEFLKWAGLIIVADLPVCTVPIGVLRSSGLPVGVQVVTPCWQDRQAIEVGKMIERVHPGAGTKVPPGYGRAKL